MSPVDRAGPLTGIDYALGLYEKRPKTDDPEEEL